MISRQPRRYFSLGVVAALALAGPLVSRGQSIVSEDFTQNANTNAWYYFNGACLTAATSASSANPGTIPSCLSIASSYYNETLVGGSNGFLGSSTAPGSPTGGVADAAGSGALRFTNGSPGGYHQNGAIVSNYTFPTSAGIQVTFKTVTYGGDNQGGHGADGISFYLMDGAQPAGIGAWGGSLAYSCSNSNYPHDGLVGAYVGLGMDEWGNFLNGSADTLGEGANPTGDNTASGGGYQPGRIGMRGAGNIAWSWLHGQYPTLYPASWTVAQQESAVQNTCSSGVLQDYNGNKLTYAGTSPYAVLDYQAIPNAWALPSFSIANESATIRSQANVIAYKLKITQDGLLSLSYSYNGGSYQSVLAKQKITDSNGPLPGSFRFGFAGSTGGSTNIHEILCFQAAPSEQAATSIGTDARQAAKITNTTQAFLAYYFPSTSTGDVTANTLLFNATTQVVSVSSTANWDASCVLTGVATGKTCPSTAVAGPIAAQGWASPSRTILTSVGGAGVPFEWANITAVQSILDSGDSTPINANRLNYLRGDTENEVNTAGVGLFRPRESILGDIVDSSPTWVGPPNSPYALTWSDALDTSVTAPEAATTAQTYAAYKTSAGTRLNVVYAGANDGLLHGFRAGSFDSNNNFVDNTTTPNDGHEVLAYMPGAVLAGSVLAVTTSRKHGGTTTTNYSEVDTIHGTDPTNSNTVSSTLDYSSTQYGHNFYVDGTPGTGDLFYGTKWHTWLVGGLGAGGAAIYALDVTDPTAFKESNAATLVLGEWTPASLTCTNVTNCGNNLGNTYGQPVIRRLHNGAWGVIFGNGFGSNTGDAGIYVMTVDPTSGAGTFYYLSTGKSGSNGIAYVYPADLDGDRIIDYVYAGDLLGNIWRFDLTSSTPGSWAAGATPLFSTPSGEPITTRPVVWIAQPGTGGTARVLVDFGTGQKTPVTNTTPAAYVTGTQYLYGIWDWNMDGWNAMSSSKYYSLTGTYTIVANGSGQNLETQTVTTNAATGELDGSTNPVCWKGSSTCTGGTTANTQFGWEMALPGTAEQVVFNPIAYRGAFVVNTTVPANNSITSCANTIDTGNTIAIDVTTGGAIPNLFGRTYNDAIGFRTDGSGSITTVNAGGKDYWITQTTDGPGSGSGGSGGSGGTPPDPHVCPSPLTWSNGTCSFPPNLPVPTGRRLTWTQKR